MTIPFLKMHGLGNDFVIIDGRRNDIKLGKEALKAIANRRRGVGFDQLIILRHPKSPEAHVFMEMYNSDGTSLRACGNATRCVARLMFDELKRKKCVIETVAGFLYAHQDGDMVTVDFGKPLLEWSDIPLAEKIDTLHVKIQVGAFADPCCVSMGNPHAVFFVSDVMAVPLAEVGPKLEYHEMFPDRCNIEFAQILSRDHIRMRVWERGAGITEACGSGACATLVAAVRRGLSDRRAKITLDGGDVLIEWRDDDHVLMTGPAALSYSGVLSDEFVKGKI